MNVELLARNIAAHWVQSGVLVVASLIAMRLLRAAAPRVRLAAFHLTCVAILLLPLVQPWRPGDEAGAAVAVAATTEVIVTKFFVARVEAPPLSPQFDLREALLAALAGGIVLRLLWLCGGVIRLVRFRRRSREVAAPDVAREVEAALGVTARYFEHSEQACPATFGILHATVMLPQKFASLDESTQHAILCHELLHVKRRDVAMAALEEVFIAVLWFHPWLWTLRSRIRVAREQVVDRTVIELTGNREVYVRCLVELSGHDLVPHLSTPMSRPRELRTRIDALLEEVAMSRRRESLTAIVVVSVVVGAGSVAAWAVPLRGRSDVVSSIPVTSSKHVVSGYSRTSAVPVAPGFTPAFAQAQQTPSTAPRKPIKTPYAEYPQDALEKRISGTVVVDVVVNPAGDVTTGAVVSGPQELRATAFKAAFGLKFEKGSGTTAMRVNVEYRLTADSWGVRVTSFEPGAPSQPQIFSVTPFGSANTEPPLSGMRIGGNIRPPTKTKDAPPIYPAIAQQARVQGVVILEARVDENGNVSDTRVLRSIPLLDQAAIDAVKQWQYTPTLLNGVAVPVIMTVTVNFTLRSQVRLKIIMPDGTLALLVVAPDGGIGRTEYPPMAKYGFAPFVDPDPSVNTVKVVVYELGELGTAPRTLGNLEVTPGAGVVQSATTPSFGIEVVSVDR